MTFRALFTVLLLLACPLSLADAPVMDEKTLSNIKQAYKAEFLATLSKLMGKEIDPNDPKAVLAAETFFAVDAAKSYAFTRIHGVALEFCPENAALKEAMQRYRNAAKVQIALGEIYYAEGFDFMVGQQRMVKSGQALTDGLNEMLQGIRQEYRSADPAEVQDKCQESTDALTALAGFYGGELPPE